MQELVLFPLLAKSQAHYFVAAFYNKQENLIVAFSLQGPDAHFFGKDLQLKMFNWQFKGAEELHLALLDLNKECRLNKLQLNFAISLKLHKQLILVCQGGSILLKRHQQLKELLSSQHEIQMVVGQYAENDQLLLIAGNHLLGQVILEKSLSQSLELILEEKLNDYLKNNFKTALVLWRYQAKEKIVWTKKLAQLKTYINRLKLMPAKLTSLWRKIKDLRQEQKKRYQKIFIAAGAIIFITMIATLLWQHQQEKTLDSIGQEISSIIPSDEELLLLSATQPVLAREKISKSQATLQELLTETSSRTAKKKIEAEIEQLQAIAEKLSSENNLDQLVIYSNWYDSYPNFLGKKILSSPQGLIVANDQKNQLLLIKEQNNFSLWENDFQDFAVDRSNSDQLNIFIKNQGIKYLNWENANLSELKSEGDSDRDALLLESYQAYLYLLNPEKRNIYRYTLRGGELSEAIGWLVEKQGINFADISDLNVDGNLWLTFKDAEIMKFDRGYQEEFSLSGLEQMPNSSLLIATQENADKLVFLDTGNNRLIVTTREGQLISEIKSNELAGVSDIVLADDGQSCFALSGSVIYQIQL
ncbi:MAG: hypothetical protein GX559_02685 [Candidatus Pacebacteria bacterium]|nr:hypothetical protein [Candidatus Paceibacterota bacterium]